MIDHVKGHANLRSLNDYLEKKLNALPGISSESVEKLDTLVKKIRLNVSCISVAENTKDDYVRFLSCYVRIKNLSVELGEDEQKVPGELENALKVARYYFGNLVVTDVLPNLLTAYPPGPVQNLLLYPIHSTDDFEGVLHMVMIPTMIRDYPDTVLDVLVKSKCKEVSIRYYGGPVEGREDRKKQFFVDLMQGLIHSSQKLKFQKTFSGKFVLSTEVQNIASQAKSLGTVLGLALRSGCPIGEVFGLEFFHSLRSFAKKGNFFWYSAGIQDMEKKDHDRLVTYLNNFALPIPEVKCIEKVLMAEKAEDVKAAAKTLNRKWHNNKLEKAIEIGDSEKIKGCVRYLWFTGFQESMAVARFVGETMMEYQPFTITTLDGNEHRIKSWSDLATVSTEEFAMQLQGE